MATCRPLVLLLMGSTAALAQPATDRLLARLAEEAEVLQQNAPKVVTLEHLEQRTVLPPTRFRPRIGAAYLESLKPMLRVREVTSEYSFGALREGGGNSLLEFRQVIAVDGKQIQSPESANKALSSGIQSTADRGRKRMLEAFAANAIGDVATDYGLIVLLFTKKGLADVKLIPYGSEWVGVDDAVTFSWEQRTSSGGALEFHGKESAHRALQGMLWVREKDGVPLRVTAWLEHVDAAKHTVRDDAMVEYVMSSHGFVTPVSIIHRHLMDGRITTENLYTYEPFRLFTTSTQITFGAPAAGPIKK